jgi:hypothetical protein
VKKSFLAVGIAVGLAACTPTPAEISEAQSLVNDGESILALGLIPPPASQYASLALTGIEALLNTTSTAVVAGVSTEATVLANLKTATTQIQADVPANSKVASDAALALAAIGALQANSGATTQTQVEAAVGLVVMDYLEAKAPASDTYGSSPSSVQKLVDDGKMHVAKMQSTGG